MKSNALRLILLLVIGTLLVLGCSDNTKNNPTRPTVSETGLLFQQNYQSFAIFFSTVRDGGNKPYFVYTPPGYDDTYTTGFRYPILYMFSPYDTDALYYLEHGLTTVADRLISEGKIDPMLIVCIDGRSLLGGSFYTNSIRQGNYFTWLFNDTTYVEPYRVAGYPNLVDVEFKAQAMVNRINDLYRTIPDKKFWGASGVGMGGYGAFRSAVATEFFGSVSAVDAPLDFDGTGSNGFLSLFQDLYPAGSHWSSVDTSATNSSMSMVVSAAAAFASHHTALQVDSVFNDNFGVLSQICHATEFLTTDSSTLVAKHAGHVPFDSTGAINSTIWDLWKANSIASLYENGDPALAANFADMSKLLIRVEASKDYFDEQMQGFMQFLDNAQMPYQTKTYGGSDILSGSADHYMYDIFEDILVFHSNSFRAAAK